MSYKIADKLIHENIKTNLKAKLIMYKIVKECYGEAKADIWLDNFLVTMTKHLGDFCNEARSRK